jgi:hypothetical protein
VNDIIVGENAYVATVGKGLKECSVKGRFYQVKIVLFTKDKDEGEN